MSKFVTDTLAKMSQSIFAYFSVSEHSPSFSVTFRFFLCIPLSIHHIYYQSTYPFNFTLLALQGAVFLFPKGIEGSQGPRPSISENC